MRYHLRSCLKPPALAVVIIGSVILRQPTSSAAPGASAKSTPIGSASANAAPSANSHRARSVELNEKAFRLTQDGHYAEAEAVFRASLAADSGNITAVYNLAGLYLHQKKAPAARELLEKYLAQQPNDPSLNARMGETLFVSKRVKEALPYFERAWAAEPESLAVQIRLSTIYTLVGRLGDAERLMRKILVKSPRHGQTLMNLASLLIAGKKYDEAIVLARRAVQVAPVADSYAILGNAYLGSGQEGLALESLKKAKTLGKSSKELDGQIKSLEQHSRAAQR